MRGRFRSQKLDHDNCDSIPLSFGSGSTPARHSRVCSRAGSGKPMTTALAPATPATPAAAPTKARGFVEGLVTASHLGESGAPMVDVALALVNAGWAVFPCGQDKAPLVGGGFK